MARPKLNVSDFSAIAAVHTPGCDPNRVARILAELEYIPKSTRATIARRHGWSGGIQDADWDAAMKAVDAAAKLNALALKEA